MQEFLCTVGAVQLVTGSVTLDAWGVLSPCPQTSIVILVTLWTVAAILKYTRLKGDYPAEALSWVQTVHKLYAAGEQDASMHLW